MDYEKITRCQLKRLKKHSDWTYRHSLRVMDHAMKIRCTLGVESQTLKELSMASRLHDIGKLAIPACILDKSDGLSEEEYRLVKCHTVYGYPPAVCEAVRAHHERYDGRGYGGRREVGILAKILCAADSYDAMKFGRPYREGYTDEEIYQEMAVNSGKQFAPGLCCSAPAFALKLTPWEPRSK